MNKNFIVAGATILALIGCYGAGYKHGASSVQSRWDQTIQEQTREDHEVLLVGMRDSFELGAAHEQQKEVIRYVTEEIIKEIPVYIRDTSTCPRMPDGFGVLFNRSAQAINDRLAAGQSDGTAGAAGVSTR